METFNKNNTDVTKDNTNESYNNVVETTKISNDQNRDAANTNAFNDNNNGILLEAKEKETDSNNVPNNNASRQNNIPVNSFDVPRVLQFSQGVGVLGFFEIQNGEQKQDLSGVRSIIEQNAKYGNSNNIASNLQTQIETNQTISTQSQSPYVEATFNNNNDKNVERVPPVKPHYRQATMKKLLFEINSLWQRAYFTFIILGICNALLAYSISFCVSYFWAWQGDIYYSSLNPGASYVLLTLFRISIILTGLWVVARFAPAAAGSGIPELRAILAGIWIDGYLSRRVIVTKIIGTIFALASGLPIGIEGPIIHISSGIASQLARLAPFRHLDRKLILASTTSGAVAAAWGAPIGGVLFSIEVTST